MESFALRTWIFPEKHLLIPRPGGGCTWLIRIEQCFQDNPLFLAPSATWRFSIFVCLLLLFSAVQRACRIFVPRTGTEPVLTAVEVPSPNPWTTREFPAWHFWVRISLGSVSPTWSTAAGWMPAYWKGSVSSYRQTSSHFSTASPQPPSPPWRFQVQVHWHTAEHICTPLATISPTLPKLLSISLSSDPFSSFVLVGLYHSCFH